MLRVKITNGYPAMRRFTVVGPFSGAFQAQTRKLGAVPPGLPETVTVAFTPPAMPEGDGILRDHLVVKSGKDILSIPLLAYPVMADLVFPKVIDFGKVALDGVAQDLVVRMACTAPVGFEFSIAEVQECAEFQVRPTRGAIAAGGTQDIRIRFLPKSPKTYSMQLRVDVSQFGFEPIFCTVTGTSDPKIAREAELARSGRPNVPMAEVHEASRRAEIAKLPKGYRADKVSQERIAASRRERLERTLAGTAKPIEIVLPKPKERMPEVELDGNRIPGEAYKVTPTLVREFLMTKPGKRSVKDVKRYVAEERARQDLVDASIAKRGLDLLLDPCVDEEVKERLFELEYKKARDLDARRAAWPPRGVFIGERQVTDVEAEAHGLRVAELREASEAGKEAEVGSTTKASVVRGPDAFWLRTEGALAFDETFQPSWDEFDDFDARFEKSCRLTRRLRELCMTFVIQVRLMKRLHLIKGCIRRALRYEDHRGTRFTDRELVQIEVARDNAAQQASYSRADAHPPPEMPLEAVDVHMWPIARDSRLEDPHKYRNWVAPLSEFDADLAASSIVEPVFRASFDLVVPASWTLPSPGWALEDPPAFDSGPGPITNIRLDGDGASSCGALLMAGPEDEMFSLYPPPPLVPTYEEELAAANEAEASLEGQPNGEEQEPQEPPLREPTREEIEHRSGLLLALELDLVEVRRAAVKKCFRHDKEAMLDRLPESPNFAPALAASVAKYTERARENDTRQLALEMARAEAAASATSKKGKKKGK